MKHLVKAAVGGIVALASAGAFAQPVLPTTGDGSVTLTLFSTNDSTPFSYSYNMGLTLSQLSTLPTAPGTSQSWSLTGLASDLSGFAGTSNLVFDVTAAAATGSIATAGSFKLASTFDPVTAPPATVAGTTSGALSAAEGHNNTWLSNWGGGTANNQFTNNAAAANYANANYGAGLNTFSYNAAASTGTALPFYELVSKMGSTSIATTSTFAGVFTIDLSSDTLTYTVPSSVPLPAGVWLLVSGLAGLGVFGRRRTVAPQA
jgi:hypothetical protein